MSIASPGHPRSAPLSNPPKSSINHDIRSNVITHPDDTIVFDTHVVFHRMSAHNTDTPF